MKKPMAKTVCREQERQASREADGCQATQAGGTKVSVNLGIGGKLTFNHAMIYVKDVGRALCFYRDLLGFKLIEDFHYEGTPVYARMCAPGGNGTIALHHAGPGVSVSSDGVRLYFEVRDLDDFCNKLQQKGFYITKLPA